MVRRFSGRVRSGRFAGGGPHHEDRDDAKQATDRKSGNRRTERAGGEAGAMKHYLLVIPAILLPGCGSRVEQFVMPDQVMDFAALYRDNCAGCHGRDGGLGAARPLNDPVFLAVIGKQKLREVIANGVPRSAMPAFAKNAGGGLTDRQIVVLSDQIEERWSRPQDFAGLAPPPYSAELGDPKAGEAVFRSHCARCHGAARSRGTKPGSVVDSAF